MPRGTRYFNSLNKCDATSESRVMPFYKLQVGRNRKFVESNRGNDWEMVRCSTNPGHQRAGRRKTELILDVLSWSVVDCSRTMLSDIVITDRALRVMQAAGLTGFVCAPTRVATFPLGVHRDAFPRLWELVVVGQAGPAHEDSGIVTLRQCDECGLVEYSAFRNGIVVNTSTYDGTDLFVVLEYPRYILVSERAKSVIEVNRLTNVSFVESTQIEWPKGVARPA
jgi:hypothetical protein